jgi:hypothetical protein
MPLLSLFAVSRQGQFAGSLTTSMVHSLNVDGHRKVMETCPIFGLGHPHHMVRTLSTKVSDYHLESILRIRHLISIPMLFHRCKRSKCK